MRSPYNIGPMTPQKLGLLSAAIPSPAGDVVGLLADAWGYAKEPESLTPAAGLLSLAGLIPGVPSSRAAKIARQKLADFSQLHKIPKSTIADLPVKWRVGRGDVEDSVSVIVNPSKGDLARWVSAGDDGDRFRTVRATKIRGNTVFWNGEDAVHDEIRRALKDAGLAFEDPTSLAGAMHTFGGPDSKYARDLIFDTTRTVPDAW